MTGFDICDGYIKCPKSTAFVVTADGWRNGYGAEIYLLGVFDNLSDAESCAKCVDVAKITAVEINKMFPLIKDKWDDLSNENYLGGYCE